MLKSLSIDANSPSPIALLGNRRESAAEVETPVTALATCRIKSECQLVSSRVATRESYEDSSVHGSRVVQERISINPGIP